jgi:hypothetical protein
LTFSNPRLYISLILRTSLATANIWVTSPPYLDLVSLRCILPYLAFQSLMSSAWGVYYHTQPSKAWCRQLEVYITIPGFPKLDVVMLRCILPYPALQSLMSSDWGVYYHTWLSKAWCHQLEVYITIPSPPRLDVVMLRCILPYPACHTIFSKLAKIMRIFVKVRNPKTHGLIWMP